MLTKLYAKVVCCALCALFFACAEVNAMPASQYLGIKRSLNASIVDLADAKPSPQRHIGKVLEITGTVNGIARGGDSASFILGCDDGSFLVRVDGELPNCISNGSKIRALAQIGTGSAASLSDLRLKAAAYDYDISRELQPPTQPQTAAKPQKPAQSSQPANLASRGGTPSNPPNRIDEIYDAYKTAIRGFNPNLSNEQAETITKSILGFSWQYQVDPRLVIAVILAESNFRPGATSPKGAMGLGQLMPGTARGLGVTNAYDPVQNIEASIRLIRRHIDQYDGDLTLVLSAYNAGPGAVRKYGGAPPFRETQNYIRKVNEYYKALTGN